MALEITLANMPEEKWRAICKDCKARYNALRFLHCWFEDLYGAEEINIKDTGHWRTFKFPNNESYMRFILTWC